MNALVTEMPASPRYGAELARELAGRGIAAVMFPAVDAVAAPVGIAVNAAKFRARYGRRPCAGEMGCFATHVRLAQAALADQAPPVEDGAAWWLVLEDDASPAGNMGAAVVRRIVAAAEAGGFGAVLLHSGRKCHRRDHPFAVAARRRRDEFGTFAYLANRRTMELLAGLVVMRRPIDHALLRHRGVRWAVLWGADRFSHRAPAAGVRAIHWERQRRRL